MGWWNRRTPMWRSEVGPRGGLLSWCFSFILTQVQQRVFNDLGKWNHDSLLRSRWRNRGRSAAQESRRRGASTPPVTGQRNPASAEMDYRPVEFGRMQAKLRKLRGRGHDLPTLFLNVAGGVFDKRVQLIEGKVHHRRITLDPKLFEIVVRVWL